MNRLKITGYVGGDHESIIAAVERTQILVTTAVGIAERVAGVETTAAVRRHGNVLQLITPGFDALDGAEIEVAPVGDPRARLTSLTVRTRGQFDSDGDQFLSAGLFTAQAAAMLQKAG